MEEEKSTFTLVEAIDLMTKNISILRTLSDNAKDEGTAFILDNAVDEISQATSYIYGYLEGALDSSALVKK